MLDIIRTNIEDTRIAERSNGDIEKKPKIVFDVSLLSNYKAKLVQASNLEPEKLTTASRQDSLPHEDRNDMGVNKSSLDSVGSRQVEEVSEKKEFDNKVDRESIRLDKIQRVKNLVEGKDLFEHVFNIVTLIDCDEPGEARRIMKNYKVPFSYIVENNLTKHSPERLAKMLKVNMESIKIKNGKVQNLKTTKSLPTILDRKAVLDFETESDNNKKNKKLKFKSLSKINDGHDKESKFAKKQAELGDIIEKQKKIRQIVNKKLRKQQVFKYPEDGRYVEILPLLDSYHSVVAEAIMSNYPLSKLMRFEDGDWKKYTKREITKATKFIEKMLASQKDVEIVYEKVNIVAGKEMTYKLSNTERSYLKDIRAEIEGILLNDESIIKKYKIDKDVIQPQGWITDKINHMADLIGFIDSMNAAKKEAMKIMDRIKDTFGNIEEYVAKALLVLGKLVGLLSDVYGCYVLSKYSFKEAMSFLTAKIISWGLSVTSGVLSNHLITNFTNWVSQLIKPTNPEELEVQNESEHIGMGVFKLIWHVITGNGEEKINTLRAKRIYSVFGGLNSILHFFTKFNKIFEIVRELMMEHWTGDEARSLRAEVLVVTGEMNRLLLEPQTKFETYKLFKDCNERLTRVEQRLIEEQYKENLFIFTGLVRRFRQRYKILESLFATSGGRPEAVGLLFSSQPGIGKNTLLDFLVKRIYAQAYKEELQGDVCYFKSKASEYDDSLAPDQHKCVVIDEFLGSMDPAICEADAALAMALVGTTVIPANHSQADEKAGFVFKHTLAVMLTNHQSIKGQMMRRYFPEALYRRYLQVNVTVSDPSYNPKTHLWQHNTRQDYIEDSYIMYYQFEVSHLELDPGSGESRTTGSITYNYLDFVKFIGAMMLRKEKEFKERKKVVIKPIPDVVVEKWKTTRGTYRVPNRDNVGALMTLFEQNKNDEEITDFTVSVMETWIPQLLDLEQLTWMKVEERLVVGSHVLQVMRNLEKENFKTYMDKFAEFAKLIGKEVAWERLTQTIEPQGFMVFGVLVSLKAILDIYVSAPVVSGLVKLALGGGIQIDAIEEYCTGSFSTIKIDDREAEIVSLVTFKKIIELFAGEIEIGFCGDQQVALIPITRMLLRKYDITWKDMLDANVHVLGDEYSSPHDLLLTAIHACRTKRWKTFFPKTSSTELMKSEIYLRRHPEAEILHGSLLSDKLIIVESYNPEEPEAVKRVQRRSHVMEKVKAELVNAGLVASPIIGCAIVGAMSLCFSALGYFAYRMVSKLFSDDKLDEKKIRTEFIVYDSAKQPKTQLKKVEISKVSSKPVVQNGIETQMSSTQAVDKMTVVAKNYAELTIMFVGDEMLKTGGRILFIKGTTFCINFHTIGYFLDPKRIKKTSLIVKHLGNESKAINLADCTITKGEYKTGSVGIGDFLFVTIPSTCGVQPKPDITKFFIREDEVSEALEHNAKLIIPTATDTLLTVNVLTPTGGKIRTTPTIATGTDYDDTKATWETTRSIMFDLETYKGSCMGFYMQDNNKFERPVFGIQGAGTGSKAFCLIITKEILDELVKDVPRAPILDIGDTNKEIEVQSNLGPLLPQFQPKGSVFIGSLPKKYNHRLNDKNTIVRTNMFPEEKPSKGPALLKETLIDGLVISPLKNAVEKLGSPDKVNKNPFMKYAWKLMKDELLKMKPVTKLKLTTKEVLNGAVSDLMSHPLRTTTSAGPIAKNNSKGYPGKKFFIQQVGEYNALTQAGIEALRAYKENLDVGIPTRIESANLKEELRPIEKVRTGSSRMFMGTMVIDLIMDSKYFGAFNAALKNHKDISRCYVGMNPNSSEWGELQTWLQESGRKNVQGDFKQNDIDTYSDELFEFFEIVQAWYKKYDKSKKAERYAERRRRLFVSSVYRIVQIARDLYALNHGTSSGVYGTSERNSVIRRVSVLQAVMYLLNTHYSDRAVQLLNDPKALFDNFRQICYGDDGILAVPSEFPLINFKSIAYILENLQGLVYTQPDKSDTEASLYTDWGKVDFLSRGVRIENGVYYAPLREDTIREIPYWRLANYVPDKEIIPELCDAALIEWFQHGEKKFRGMKEHYDNELERNNYPLTKLTYAKAYADWLSGY